MLLFSSPPFYSYPNTTAYIWRSNSQIIQNPNTKKTLEDCLSNYFQIISSSTDNAFLLWNAHKAYIRGIFIQLGAINKKQRQQKITTLITEIELLEAHNKNNPTPSTNAKLPTLRHDLRLILLHAFEHQEKKTKMSFYSTTNKAGKALARKIQGQRFKTKLAHLIHPKSKQKVYDPQGSGAFSDYYSSL